MYVTSFYPKRVKRASVFGGLSTVPACPGSLFFWESAILLLLKSHLERAFWLGLPLQSINMLRYANIELRSQTKDTSVVKDWDQSFILGEHERREHLGFWAFGLRPRRCAGAGAATAGCSPMCGSVRRRQLRYKKIRNSQRPS